MDSESISLSILLESCKKGYGLESENARVPEKTNGTWLQLVRSCTLSTVL